MKRSHIIVALLLAGLVAELAVAQTESQLRRAAAGKPAASQEEVVNYKSDVQLNEVFPSLFELWKKFGGKIVIDRVGASNLTTTIGMDIIRMYWKDAFEMLLRQNNLWYREFPDYVEVVTPDMLNQPPSQTEQPVTTPTLQQQQIADTPAQQPSMTQPAFQQPAQQQQPLVEKVDSAKIYSEMREITISSIFFQVDRTALAQSGVSFSIFRGRGLNLGIEFTGSEKISTPILGAQLTPSDPRLSVDVNAAIKMFESDQLGEVLARPQVTVRSGSAARFQSGQDFSIKQRDFSGNIIDQFYQTGTILTVIPKYYEYEGTEFITLTYKIERSSATPGEVTTLVDKVDASGVITLLDGEETYVGGLYSTSETTVREGIPLLKDLPWWFFGLRYLFGFDSKNVQKKELIVLMRAELVPLLKDRQEQAKSVDALQKARKDMQQDQQRRTKKK